MLPTPGRFLHGALVQQHRARREVREPDIVVVEPREVRFWDAARGPAHGSDPQALVPPARCAESHDEDGHFILPTVGRQTTRPDGRTSCAGIRDRDTAGRRYRAPTPACTGFAPAPSGHRATHDRARWRHGRAAAYPNA